MGTRSGKCPRRNLRAEERKEGERKGSGGAYTRAAEAEAAAKWGGVSPMAAVAKEMMKLERVVVAEGGRGARAVVAEEE
jgi:hypothetical protein